MAEPNTNVTGDGLGPTPGVELDTYYLTRIKRLEEFQAKLASGGSLQAQEYEELDMLTREFEGLRQNNPDLFNRLTAFIDTTRAQTGTAGPGGDKTGSVADIINSTFSSSSTSKRQTNTKETAVQYVDLPTPEEFLDDFTNAYNIHITGLVQSGAISPAVAAFAREMQNEVFGEYLRDQTARLLKGEPLWKVVGANADNKLVGSRTGEQVDRNTEFANEEQSSETTSSTGTSTATSGTEAGQVVDSASQSGTTSGTRKEKGTADEQFRQTEAIVARNRLSYVSNLAPLDFLKDGAQAQRLNFLYAGQKGTAQREAQTATGPNYSTGARRV